MFFEREAQLSAVRSCPPARAVSGKFSSSSAGALPVAFAGGAEGGGGGAAMRCLPSASARRFAAASSSGASAVAPCASATIAFSFFVFRGVAGFVALGLAAFIARTSQNSSTPGSKRQVEHGPIAGDGTLALLPEPP
jgi:hypothetical protein